VVPFDAKTFKNKGFFVILRYQYNIWGLRKSRGLSGNVEGGDKQVSPAFIYEAEGFVLKRFRF